MRISLAYYIFFIVLVFTVSIIPSYSHQPKLVLPMGHTDVITTVQFSPDGKTIVTAGNDNIAKLWDAATGLLLADLKGHEFYVLAAQFSPDGKKIVTASSDGTAKIWDASGGTLLVNLKGHTDNVRSAWFSPDGKKVVTGSADSTVKTWDAVTGKLLITLKRNDLGLVSGKFVPGGTKIITNSYTAFQVWNAITGGVIHTIKKPKESYSEGDISPDGEKVLIFGANIATILNTATGKPVAELKAHTRKITDAKFSADGKKVITSSTDRTAKIWDAVTGQLLTDLKGYTSYFRMYSLQFSHDGNKIINSMGDNTVRLWDAISGKLLVHLKSEEFDEARFSPDGKTFVTASRNHTASVWETATGKRLSLLQGRSKFISAARFSSDGKKIVTEYDDEQPPKVWDAVTGSLLPGVNYRSVIPPSQLSPDGKKKINASSDTTADIEDAVTGAHLFMLKGTVNRGYIGQFSPDGKKILTTSWDDTAKIWDAENGNLLYVIAGVLWVSPSVIPAHFSADSKKIIVAAKDAKAKIYDASDGKLLIVLKGHTSYVNTGNFSPDGKTVVTTSWDHTAKVWDASTGQHLSDLKGHSWFVTTAEFSPDGKNILSASADGTCKVWDSKTGLLLYTFFAVDSTDYLVVDKDNHYDGTSAARKLLYYTCGMELIELQQLKDKLWVPNLAERIMKRETINAPKLSELNICGLTPLVEPVENKTGYQFKITPRKGGIGETILYVNGIETKKYTAAELTKNATASQLLVNKEEIKKYFIAGKENIVTVKAYTKENDIASRGATVNDSTDLESTPPNLYAVIIGVSDYKGDELDLKYAAKDAMDIGNAVSTSAAKLLGTEHVFIYNLNTGKDRTALPEKKGIKEVFTAIGKKAKTNDILLVFFAGHGVVEGIKKQFYFLTADAAISSIGTPGIADVGITTQELTEWMKPDNIKAQKRILILDACHSGQAINQLVSIGNKDQNYLAARNDDKGQEIKQIDKLNEKAGLYILAASASNQSAYELGRFSQGVLTYSLLKVIKEQPGILENNKYLNVSNWFNAAAKTVTDIVKENNLRQEPQLITTTNFNIGIVDKDVLAKIHLPNEKAMFTISNFQNNDVAIMDDDLALSILINNRLSSVAARGVDSKIAFTNTTASSEVWSLAGRYIITGNAITVLVNLKQNSQVKNKFEVKGTKANLSFVADQIVNTASEWLEQKL